MTRDELIAYIGGLTDRSGLLDHVLAVLMDDADQIARLEKKAAEMTERAASNWATVEFERGQYQKRVDEIGERWQAANNRLRASIDHTHRIGVAVLKAQQAGRKTVRIADVIGGET